MGLRFGVGDGAEVSYAVRFGVVCKYLGQLCLATAILTGVPGAFAMACGEFRWAPAYFIAAVPPAIFGLATWKLKSPRSVQRNEAIVIAALIFPITAAVMTGPFMTYGLSFEQSLFEAVSGVTTTGLSTVGSIEELPRSFLFARAWQQWYGGLGIVALSLALSIHPGDVMRRLGFSETQEGDVVGGTLAHARWTFLIYSVFTLAGFVVLWALGLSWFDALAHSLAAVSTGGFATHDNSLADFPNFWTQAATIGICCLCATSLPLYWRVGREGWRAMVRELQIVAMFILATLGCLLLIALLVRGGESWSLALRHASVMAFSAQTTAGFSNVLVEELDSASKLVLIFSMAVGGCTESTAGGFKVWRLIIMLRLAQTLLMRTAFPRHAVYKPSWGKHRLDDQEIQSALLLILLFIAVILFSWLPFLAMGFDPLDSLFEVVSATGTVGLSAGVCCEDLPPILMATLCFDMLLGRLEIIALMVVLFPRTWFGKRVATS